MNEGWACFWHYTLLNSLYDERLVTDEFMLEFLQNHSAVIYQQDYNSPSYSGINPYTLGYYMMQDIKRICEAPTEEDKLWFPNLANTPWLNSLDNAMKQYKDESFIAQYLSPKIIRDLKLFHIIDDAERPDILVNAIHDESGYQKIRQALANQYNISQLNLDIQVFSVDLESDRKLTLRYTQQQRAPLNHNTQKVLKHLHTLWKFPVSLQTVSTNGNIGQEEHWP